MITSSDSPFVLDSCRLEVVKRRHGLLKIEWKEGKEEANRVRNMDDVDN